MAIIGAWRIKYIKSKKRKPRKKMPCYADRNARLAELGYSGYREYLKSDDWKRIRDKRLAAHPACLICESNATQVHHLDYSFPTLLGLIKSRLVPLCGKCHEGIEFADGKKSTLEQANAALMGMAMKAGRGRWVESVARSAKRVAELAKAAECNWRQKVRAAEIKEAKMRAKREISQSVLARVPPRNIPCEFRPAARGSRLAEGKHKGA